MRLLLVVLLLLSSVQPSFRVLAFSKTTGFRHDSIGEAHAALQQLGAEHGFAVDATEDAATFNDSQLATYSAVVFLLTTGDVLDEEQQAAFERYIRAGGGYVGVHSASDTEYDWAWYGSLVGAYFADHPPGLHQAVVYIEPQGTWVRTDEWYNFRSNPRAIPEIQVLASVDESTYSGGTMGDHPIAWQHGYDGGRAWYTAAGHTLESYREPEFLAHLASGVLYAAGVQL
jgi:cytochrome c